MRNLSEQELRAMIELLYKIQEKLARGGGLSLQQTVIACQKGFKRSTVNYVWMWMSGLLDGHASLSSWLDAYRPGWREGKTPAMAVYARAEHGWFNWLVAQLEDELRLQPLQS